MTQDFSSELERITKNESKERHSYFQLQYFLIGKEPTVQAKMWRCIRELKTRKESMEALNLEIEDVNDDMELLNIESVVPCEPFDKVNENVLKISERKKNRKKIGLQHRLTSLQNRLKSLEEESAFIVKAFQSLEKVQELKPYDDLEAQKEYWNEKLSQDFNLRTLFGMPLDLELIKTILALNSDAPIKIDALNIMNSIQQKIENNGRQMELEKIMSIAKYGVEDSTKNLERTKENGV